MFHVFISPIGYVKSYKFQWEAENYLVRTLADCDEYMCGIIYQEVYGKLISKFELTSGQVARALHALIREIREKRNEEDSCEN